MSITVAGYNPIEVLYESSTTLVYRALREVDQTPVIIKTFKAEYPTIEQFTRLRHEYKILKGLKIEGIAQPLGLESYQNGLALILSDFGGEPLKNAIATQTFELNQFLSIAIQLAEILSHLHENNIIHKDIKPHNILFNAQISQIKIIDFSIASQLSKENQTIANLNWLEGTLAYMSPEQTGRMNRSIDYRTDFYSLGVTLYEMLTGQLPFPSTDLLELVHCHIAKTPVPPSEIEQKVPHAVSDIVMKLLAKTAEERYQSALGLKADLETCIRQLQTTGKIENFPVGQLDLCSQFIISQHLYGREREVATLMDAFNRVSLGATEMMLVSGYSGVGKSSLVNEVHKPIVRQRGYFISGKFDQFKRNIPYAALIQAFQELIRQLLAESADNLAIWKAKLLQALGSNAQVMIDVIHEVERMIGPQPAVPQLGFTESQNRFNRVFQNFIQVFTQKEHPLVLFLDDLQWADVASLKLIQLLACDPDSQYLLILGAYRDNEVTATHPLMLTLDAIQKSGASVNTTILQPLQITHVNQLISDTFRTSLEKSKSLAELVFSRTQGNPFFLTQLLKSLYQDELLSFNFNQGTWQWEVESWQDIDSSENVVELMVNQIQKLSQKTQNTLKLAACIGDKFTLDVLAIVNEKSQPETADDLREALQSGLILPLSEAYKAPLVLDLEASTTSPVESLKVSYKFLHDRVQQAAYCLIPDSQKRITHLKIGRLILQNLAAEERKENIFALVNQLNYGITLLSSKEDKHELAELNLIAGQKAKLATAYESAIRYLKMGLSLLSVASWHQRYELTLALHRETAEVAFLNGDFELMEQLAEVVLQQAKTQLDKVKIYEVRIKAYEVQRQQLEAVRIGLQALDILGVKLIESPTPLDIQQSIEETTANLAGKEIEDLINLPPIIDTNKLAAFRLITSLVPAAYQSSPTLFILMACQQVNLSIQYGNTPWSASGFADYGLVFSGLFQDIDTGYKFGQLALNLLQRLDTREARSQTLFKVATFIIPWKHHVRDTLHLFEDAYSSGLEYGDLVHTGYSASNKCQYSYWSGSELKSLEQEMAKYSRVIDKINQETALKWHQIFHQTVLNLLGNAKNPCQLVGDAYNEEKLLPLHIQANERTTVHYVFLNKLILCYLFSEFSQAAQNATQAEQYLDGVLGWLTVPFFYFYDSLAQLAVYPSVPYSHQQHLLSRVRNNQDKMQKWATHAPMNFQHKYELVEAEKARVLGQNWQAMEFYDRAIAGAKAQGYLQEEALAHELAARFYFAVGKEKFAQLHLTEAYYGYIRWGAVAKVKSLESQYPQFFSQVPNNINKELEINGTISSTTKGDSANFDLAAVLKASQAFSGEIILGELLKNIVQILLENAGAESAFLILEKAGQWLIEASGSVDKDEIIVQQSVPVETSQQLPLSIINYVRQMQDNVILNDATCEGDFTTDTYILNSHAKSILCAPIAHQGKLIGILYLENNLTKSVFTPERVEVLQLLSSQAAISIENARLYQDLENYSRTLEAKVKERTHQLEEKNLHLEQEIRVREAAIRERKQAEEVAEAANRAKSEFLANMSHELRTPLNAILGYAQIFKKYKNFTQQQANGLDIIHQCGEHLLTLINDILDLSKIEARKMELYPKEFYFPTFINGISEICRIHAEQKGISLIYKTLSPLPKIIRADEKRLRQVLINLLSNAVKFTENGSITFQVGYQEGKLRFQVEDTGIGIAPEQLEAIFLPFQQVGKNNRKSEGTGLGLAISRQLVRMMSGELKVKSSLGKGSVFWLDLDLSEVAQSVDVANSLQRNIMGFVGSQRRILVVDDQSVNRSVLVNLLEPIGFEVLEATNGLDALDKAHEFKPHVIFMDLVMTVMDGFEATRRLRMLPDFKDVVVIAVSASVFDFNRQQSRDVGCDDFLSKPVREAELLEKLRLHLELEWVYEEANHDEQEQENVYPTSPTCPPDQVRGRQTLEFIVPPAKDVAALLDLARRGDLRGLVKRAHQLEELDERLAPFATHICQLAKEFKGKQIREFLKQF